MENIHIGKIIKCVIISDGLMGYVVQLPDNKTTGLMVYKNFNGRLYKPYKGEMFTCRVIRKIDNFIDLINIEN